MTDTKQQKTKSVIGENIKRFRISKGITQKQLAEAIGNKPQQISQYENGIRFPKIDKLFSIADVLGIEEIDLLLGRRNGE